MTCTPKPKIFRLQNQKYIHLKRGLQEEAAHWKELTGSSKVLKEYQQMFDNEKKWLEDLDYWKHWNDVMNNESILPVAENHGKRRKKNGGGSTAKDRDLPGIYACILC